MCEHGDTVDVEVLVDASLSYSGRDEWKPKPIDRCIAPLVAAFQAAGMNMRGSCCGHGKSTGSIRFADGRTLCFEWHDTPEDGRNWAWVDGRPHRIASWVQQPYSEVKTARLHPTSTLLSDAPLPPVASPSPRSGQEQQ